jgi:hypothetical protein
MDRTEIRPVTPCPENHALHAEAIHYLSSAKPEHDPSHHHNKPHHPHHLHHLHHPHHASESTHEAHHNGPKGHTAQDHHRKENGAHHLKDEHKGTLDFPPIKGYDEHSSCSLDTTTKGRPEALVPNTPVGPEKGVIPAQPNRPGESPSVGTDAPREREKEAAKPSEKSLAEQAQEAQKVTDSVKDAQKALDKYSSDGMGGIDKSNIDKRIGEIDRPWSSPEDRARLSGLKFMSKNFEKLNKGGFITGPDLAKREQQEGLSRFAP